MKAFMTFEPKLGCESDGEQADALRHAAALADIAAGRLIPNDEVCAWLDTWGTSGEKPALDKWFK